MLIFILNAFLENQRSKKRKRETTNHRDNIPPTVDDQPSLGNRCPFCFLDPCIVDSCSTALWIGPGQDPSDHNPSIRKGMYKRFWSCISNLGGWLLPQYLRKKQLCGNGDNVVYHKREVMPECVLKFCRSKYPNYPNVPYLGHKWQ